MWRLWLILFLISAIQAQDKYWIFFRDKCTDETAENIEQIVRNTLSDRAIARRDKLGIKLDKTDLPVCAVYIDSLKSLGFEVLRKSKWLNAVSIKCEETDLIKICSLNFVKEAKRVKTYTYIGPEKREIRIDRRLVDTNWGVSREQATFVGADKMHELGFSGGDGEDRIFIGMLDSGFDLSQRCFNSLTTSGRLLNKYDFVHKDTSVGFVEGDFDKIGWRHGTMTLSVIAADLPGEMMGIAPDALIALAKTEITDSTVGSGTYSIERKREEDNWIAGIEWLDSLGVDIASSSLGYVDFDDDTAGSYTFDDLDGNTALVTIAADFAAAKGIAVFNSAGNERSVGSSFGFNHVITPADGDSVCAVGGVTFNKVYATFSSPGPTADGRIKPDLTTLAQGVAVWDTQTSFADGTSFSAPALAALAALVLQAIESSGGVVSGWNLVEILKNSADQSFVPDNDYGCGIPNGPVAAGLLDGFFGYVLDSASNAALPNTQVVFNSETLITDGRGRFFAYMDSSGDYKLSVSRDGFHPFHITINHIAGNNIRYSVKLVPYSTMDEIIYYPNPFLEKLIISWFTGESGERKRGEAKIFSASGNFINKLETEEGSIEWNGENKSGEKVASGIYLIKVKAFGGEEKELTDIGKILYIQ